MDNQTHGTEASDKIETQEQELSVEKSTELMTSGLVQENSEWGSYAARLAPKAREFYEKVRGSPPMTLLQWCKAIFGKETNMEEQKISWRISCIRKAGIPIGVDCIDRHVYIGSSPNGFRVTNQYQTHKVKNEIRVVSSIEILDKRFRALQNVFDMRVKRDPALLAETIALLDNLLLDILQ